MVRVKVGGDDPRQSAAAKRPREQGLPRRARLRVVNSRIDDRQALTVFDEIDVDVIEPKRKGKARPQDARTNLDRFAGFRRIGIGKNKRIGRHATQHSYAFIPSLPRRSLPHSSGKKRGAPIASSSPSEPFL